MLLLLWSTLTGSVWACLGILLCNDEPDRELCPCRCVLDTKSEDGRPNYIVEYGPDEFYVDCRLARHNRDWELLFVDPE